MKIETVLCPIHMSQSFDHVLSIAELCVNENSHLNVVLFGESILPPLMLEGDSGGAEQWARQMIEIELMLEDRSRELSMALDKTGVRSCVEFETGDGSLVGDVIGTHAIYADITIAPRLVSKESLNPFSRRAFHGVLFDAGKPLLVTGESAPDCLDFKTILVAWDGKRAASRSVTESLPLLRKARNVHVLSVDSDKNLAPGSDAVDCELSNYLARHNIKVTEDARESMGAPISSVIQKRAMEIGSDLIVCGSYGRSRLRERIFGGTTNDLLNVCALPLLMVH